MYLTGFADEAGSDIDTQIKAVKELGWEHLECRNVGDKNLTLISDPEFDVACEKLSTAGIKVSCFGSGIANWAKKLSDSPDSSYDEMKKAIPRMQRLGTKMIRIMSFALPSPVPLSDTAARKEAMKRLSRLVAMAEEGGVICVHENCAGWAGQSIDHTRAMLDEIKSPSLKLVFDTGNPVGDKDVRGNEPYRFQDSWEFYRAVREQIAYIHIKDAIEKNGKADYCFPGEGTGCVKRILIDLRSRGYDGGLSIEPHLAVVPHDGTAKPDAQIRYDNYIEYGRRMENILATIGWKTHPS
jgi:sugar phosphate isomerase/epimerase